MNIQCEWIGVEEDGNKKWWCPSCHNIILTSSKKNITCPNCQLIIGSEFTLKEIWQGLKFLLNHVKIRRGKCINFSVKRGWKRQ